MEKEEFFEMKEELDSINELDKKYGVYGLKAILLYRIYRDMRKG